MLRSRSLIILLVLAAFTGLIAYIATGPVRTIKSIQVAINNQDIATLNKNIDFPLVRSNLKTRMNQAMLNNMQKAQQIAPNQPMGALAGAGAGMLGWAMVGMMIDRLVAPEMLIMAGAASQHPNKTKAEQQTIEERLGSKRQLSFKSPNKAEVSFGDQKGKLVIILDRRGLNWVVVDLNLDVDGKSVTG